MRQVQKQVLTKVQVIVSTTMASPSPSLNEGSRVMEKCGWVAPGEVSQGWTLLSLQSASKLYILSQLLH